MKGKLDRYRNTITWLDHSKETRTIKCSRKVCVHGLGYVGLPTAVVLAASGYDVVGYDVNPAVVDRIERYELRFDEAKLRTLTAEQLSTGSLSVATKPKRASYHLLCVPTPLDDNRNRADLSFVETATSTIAPLLRDGDTVVLESTVPPGTTVEVVKPILMDRASTEEFRLAYSPETVLPGDILTELRQNDRIVGGVDDESTDATIRLFESFVEGGFHRTDATTAELAKIAQNTYRDVNIALANEFARLADDYEVDSREAIAVSNTHPRVSVLQPGPGVGGHCLPVDPWFLAHDSNRLELVACARRVNDQMVVYVADLVETHLDNIDSARISVLGVAYKGGVDDVRRSPALRLTDELRVRGVKEVRLHDPLVSSDDVFDSVEDVLNGADALVVVTDHDEYYSINPKRAAELMRTSVVVDTRAMLDIELWKDSGFKLSTI